MLSVMVSLSNVSLFLIGDFNCRTDILQDYHDHTNNVPVLEEIEHIFENFMTPRSSCDTVITSSGKRLIDFCKTYGTYTANGRLGRDKNRGSFTYIGPKVVV